MPNHLMAAVQLHRLTGVIYCCFPRNSSTSPSSQSIMDKVFPRCYCIYVVDIYPCYKDFCRVFVCVYVYSMLVLYTASGLERTYNQLVRIRQYFVEIFLPVTFVRGILIKIFEQYNCTMCCLNLTTFCPSGTMNLITS